MQSRRAAQAHRLRLKMLRDRLRDRQDEIIARWRELTCATYPEQTRKFLAGETDRFANPVGHAIDTALPALFDELLGAMEPESLRRGLDEIVRMRAVQEFSAAEAVGFVLLLKEAVAGTFALKFTPMELVEVQIFERRIDQLLLIAFDLYVAHRERVYEIRARETEARSAKLVERLEKGKR